MMRDAFLSAQLRELEELDESNSRIPEVVAHDLKDSFGGQKEKTNRLSIRVRVESRTSAAKSRPGTSFAGNNSPVAINARLTRNAPRVAGATGCRRDATSKRFVATSARVAKCGQLQPASRGALDDAGSTSERRHREASRPVIVQSWRNDGEAAVAEGQHGAEYRAGYRKRLPRRGKRSSRHLVALPALPRLARDIITS